MRHNLNDVLQNFNPLNHPEEPMHYSIPLPGLNNNQLTIQSDSSTNNGIFGWLGNVGQNIQNAFRPPPPGINQQNPGSGPLSTLFRPITSWFNRNPDQIENNQVNNQGGLFGFFQNIPIIGGGSSQNSPNYNNVEQFSSLQAETVPSIPGAVTQGHNTDYYDYDIPIIRPLAVNTNQQQSPIHHTYSNLIRSPPQMIPIVAYDETPMMIPNGLSEDGWFKKLMKRHRLQQQLKKEAKKEIKQMNKKIRKVVATGATPGFGGGITN